MLSIALFVIIFLAVTNWFQILAFASVSFREGVKTSRLDDKWIYETVLKKTGLKLTHTALFYDKKMYGMMAGLPFWPKIILSQGLYKNLNKDELEWVILHEAGHCVLWHNMEALFFELGFLFFGLVVIVKYNINIYWTIFISVIFALLCIQIIRWFIEYQADKFSIKRVNNPRGVITAQEKFRNSKYKNLFHSEKSIGRFFLVWNIYPAKRIQMAEARLKYLSSSESQGNIS